MQLNPTFNNQAYQRFSVGGFQNAGFDGVEVHGANGYLLYQFTDPKQNFPRLAKER